MLIYEQEIHFTPADGLNTDASSKMPKDVDEMQNMDDMMMDGADTTDLASDDELEVNPQS